jgi:hypothetical protein
MGLGETTAGLLWHPGSGPSDPALASWRERVTALRPRLYRLLVDWSKLQPDRARPADLARRADGCARGIPPCAAYAGIRDQLRAVRSQQLAGGGFAVVAVVYGTPAWAAAPPSGCEPPDTQPYSRPIAPGAVGAYRRLIRDLDALARRERVDIRWWSPWNEPNAPAFLSPQRAACDGASPTVAVGPYATLARAMRAELDALPGAQRLVLGDLAGLPDGRPRSTGTAEFVRALPDDVVCAADVAAQHSYTETGPRAPGDLDPVAAIEGALAARPCSAGMPVWVTEAGVGGPDAGAARPTGGAALRAQCRAQQRDLRRWAADPRVQAVFQYTFREDVAYPVGLADAALKRAYPTYDLLRAWGARAPDGPPAALPASCRG